ncbi:unnamed protein product [Ranitomeya imitator]|uniref:Uncharacterized protein n=1 Tax=Ranitomeya imitator TaxID=111125 RepID=A0ABN9LVJ9_9NEOB|nr:unnamed protein product [Ranitomeya imitator]
MALKETFFPSWQACGLCWYEKSSVAKKVRKDQNCRFSGGRSSENASLDFEEEDREDADRWEGAGGYISVIKMHFGMNLPAGRFGGRTAHAPAILQDGCAQGEDGRTDTGTPAKYCKKKAPEAVQALLPEETSACVLRSAEEIAVSLAVEKGCTWLNTNIAALIRREVKATFNHMVKLHSAIPSLEGLDVKRGCREGCEHKVTRPSKLLTEIKEILCIALGPRNKTEGVEITELKRFINCLSETLNCRKYLTTTTEHNLAKCTVEMASLIVSDQIPLLGYTTSEEDLVQQQSRKLEETRSVLTSLLTVWGNDFRVPVPVQLIFSLKTITNNRHVQTCKDKEAPKRSAAVPKRKTNRCPLCSNKLPDGHSKKLCDGCMSGLLKEEQSSFLDSIKTIIREEVQSTVSALMPVESPRPKRPRWEQDPISDSVEGECSSAILPEEIKISVLF